MNGLSKIIEGILANRLLSHVLFWVMFCICNIIYGLGYGMPILVSWYLLLVTLPAQMIGSYLFIYWQMPLLLKKKYWRFALALFLPTYFLYLITHINFDFGIGLTLTSNHQPHSLYSILTDLETYFPYMVSIYWVVLVVAGIKLVKDQFESKRLMENLEAEKAKSEYHLLQSKLQPEFMLRSIQLIKNLSLQSAPETPETIADLSDILDHALYRSNQSRIALSYEMDKMISYAKLYAAGSNQIQAIHIDKGNDGQGDIIAPMTLVNVIESLLEQIKNHTVQQIEGVVLSEGNQCILQLTIAGDDITIDKAPIFDILDANYADQHEIIIDDGGTEIELQISIRL